VLRYIANLLMFRGIDSIGQGKSIPFRYFTPEVQGGPLNELNDLQKKALSTLVATVNELPDCPESLRENLNGVLENLKSKYDKSKFNELCGILVDIAEFSASNPRGLDFKIARCIVDIIGQSSVLGGTLPSLSPPEFAN
jgi:hypothetical protein